MPAPQALPYKYGTLTFPYNWDLGDLSGAPQNGKPQPCNAAHAPCSVKGDSLALMQVTADSGVGFVRMDVTGQFLYGESRAQSSPDFSRIDAMATALHKLGLTEMPVCENFGSPPWENGGYTDTEIWSSPRDYANFCGVIAAHFVRNEPWITEMEIPGNEPNLDGNWKCSARNVYCSGAPNPEDGNNAAQYMIDAYGAIKAADPLMVVVGPALAGAGPNYVPVKTFAENLYRNGCKTAVCWDVVSTHDYQWTDPNAAKTDGSDLGFYVYRIFQNVAVANGDVKPPVAITEWGFCEGIASNSSCFSPAVQATYMSHGLTLFSRDPSVQSVVWTAVWDAGAKPNLQCTDFFLMMGLLPCTDKDAPPPETQALPAWHVLRRAASVPDP